MTRNPLIAAALIVALTAPPYAAAQSSEPEEDAPLGEFERMQRSAREALEALEGKIAPYLESFGDAIGALDDYGSPEILPNGDILIPRKRPEPDSETEDERRPAPADPDGAPDTIDL